MDDLDKLIASMTNDATNADYISSRSTGSEILTEFRSASNSPALRPAAPQTGGSTGSSENVFGRPLLSPLQLYAMPSTRSIRIQHGNLNPIMTTREQYFEQPSFYGIPYAPHPVEDAAAFRWMGEYLARYAAAT